MYIEISSKNRIHTQTISKSFNINYYMLFN